MGQLNGYIHDMKSRHMKTIFELPLEVVASMLLLIALIISFSLKYYF